MSFTIRTQPRVVLEPSLFCCNQVAELVELHGYQQFNIKTFVEAITRTPGVLNSPAPLPEDQADIIEQAPHIFKYQKLYNSNPSEHERYFIPDPVSNDFFEVSVDQFERSRQQLAYTDEGQYVMFKCWNPDHTSFNFRVHRLVHVDPTNQEPDAVKRGSPSTPPADYGDYGDYKITKTVGGDNRPRGQMWMD
ncbi:uncharacterized protein PAC_11087 [Phialocephala subalpina]|uniref:Uncharacterized protein n=1 Tax=Phialocephala subalpina TaxID=576137 RepID=A0A1L7X852_9HELO|nr:uncharacterized protein PAC_11087 [Phialocephala subalpina]